MFDVIKRIRGQGYSKTPLCRPSDEKLLLRPCVSYNKLLDRAAIRILLNIDDGCLLFVKVNNCSKTSTVSAKKLHCRCSTGFQMRLRLEKCCKCEVQVNYKCTNFVATYWCAGKQLRRDRTRRERDLLDNFYIDRKTFNIVAVLFLANSNSATEVVATLIAKYFLLT